MNNTHTEKGQAMRTGVLGTGMVGQAIGSKLIQLGHEVKMGSRTADNEKATQWVKANGVRSSLGMGAGFRVAGTRYLRFLVVAGLWATLPQATAQNARMKPGLWEFEMVFEIPDAPQEGFTNKWQHCIKEEEAKRGPVFDDAYATKGAPKKGECRIENIRYPEPGHVTYDVVCGDKEYRIKVEYRYTETSFEGTSRTVSEGQTITYKMKGRYVGPCKK